MKNIEVEKLVRDKYALRDCDRVDVEFIISMRRIEEYVVTDYIELERTHIRKSRVFVKGTTLISCEVESDESY